MKILDDSVEYKCWHEVGHAAVCLHLGGDVDFIQFLDGHTRGHARTRCMVTPGNERSVACGGFAAEFYLLDKGYAAQEAHDERDISQVVFHNATGDREDFWRRRLGKDEVFSETEDRSFMHHALGVALPIINQHFSRMQEVVQQLHLSREISGRQVRELLRL